MNLHRLRTLIVKERKQLLRDRSSIVLGLLMPVILLLIFGYGMSLDLRNIKLVIVEQEPSSLSAEVCARFRASEYFTVNTVRSTAEGSAAIRDHSAEACLFLPRSFKRNAASGSGAVLIAVNASNPSQARITETYIRGILSSTLNSSSGVQLKTRMWFNDTNESSYFMIPGVIVIIMSLIGTRLTSMLMAREYEHGNLESMFATPMESGEILLAKALNNFLLGLVGLAVSLLFAHFLFHLPLRGSLWVLVAGSSVYLLLSLAMGLLISSVTKNQFLACELTMVITFMPVFLLSGFLYEIPNMPIVVQYITYLVPARYYVDFLQTVFLVGNVWSNICYNIGILSVFTIVLMVIAKFKNPKSLEG